MGIAVEFSSSSKRSKPDLFTTKSVSLDVSVRLSGIPTASTKGSWKGMRKKLPCAGPVRCDAPIIKFKSVQFSS